MPRWRKGTTFQSLSFDKEQWTAPEARHWAKVNGFRASSLKEDARTIHLQQRDPNTFRRTTFRTVQLDDGVQAVVAVPLDPVNDEHEDQTFSQALVQLRSEISDNRKYVQSEWQRQRKSVAQTVSRVRRARKAGPDPIGNFFAWVRKSLP